MDRLEERLIAITRSKALGESIEFVIHRISEQPNNLAVFKI
jgi:hypothetical protein